MDVIKFPVNLLTTCGLQILLHGVILLPDATSYDKINKTEHSCKILYVLQYPILIRKGAGQLEFYNYIAKAQIFFIKVIIMCANIIIIGSIGLFSLHIEHPSYYKLLQYVNKYLFAFTY